MYYSLHIMSFESDAGWPMPTPEEIDLQVAAAMPESCGDCAVQCDLATELGKLIFAKHLSTFASEHLVGEAGEEFNAMIDQQVPPEHAEEVKKAIRGAAAAGMDDVDMEIDRTKDEMNFNAAACDGVLKMRATKADTTYTATICTSSAQYPISDKNHVSSHIKSSPAK